ncbi:MAG: hypothetical protein IJ079_09730 [Lachnospiraceae bacterium]|nr:hypothetical protein [Lachnospiraceae bacterium]
MTRKEIESLTPDRLEKKKKDELLFFLDEVRLEYQLEMLKKELCDKIQSFATTSELLDLKTFIDVAYEKHIAQWGILHGCRDNLTVIANALLQDLRIDELNHLSSLVFWECLDNMPEYLSLLPYLTDEQKQVLANRGKES